MTRINVGLDPEELADDVLLAEHREMTRIPNAVRSGRANLDAPAPEAFCLGPGHVRFFYRRLGYLQRRYAAVYVECESKRNWRKPTASNASSRSHSSACRSSVPPRALLTFGGPVGSRVTPANRHNPFLGSDEMMTTYAKLSGVQQDFLINLAIAAMQPGADVNTWHLWSDVKGSLTATKATVNALRKQKYIEVCSRTGEDFGKIRYTSEGLRAVHRDAEILPACGIDHPTFQLLSDDEWAKLGMNSLYERCDYEHTLGVVASLLEMEGGGVAWLAFPYCPYLYYLYCLDFNAADEPVFVAQDGSVLPVGTTLYGLLVGWCGAVDDVHEWLDVLNDCCTAEAIATELLATAAIVGNRSEAEFMDHVRKCVENGRLSHVAP